MLGLLPQDFDAVQFRAVRRQKEQAQSASRPAPPTMLDSFRTMNPGVIQHHDVRLGTDLLTESIEEGDHIVLSCGPLDGFPDQRLVLIERAEHIDALPMRLRFNRMCLTARCPAVGDWRVRAKAGLIEEEQAAQPLPGQFGQLGEDGLGPAKGRFITLFFTSYRQRL